MGEIQKKELLKSATKIMIVNFIPFFKVNVNCIKKEIKFYRGLS